MHFCAASRELSGSQGQQGTNVATGAKTAESVREQVILANQEFYKQIAAKYDHYEYVASNSYFQRLIEDDLRVIEKGLSGRKRGVRCLDCGGGTGNVTLKMLRLGWEVTVVDVSEQMLSILEGKVAAAGRAATFVHDSIENYLSADTQCFDVISFSSVLHHLYAPLSVVERAAGGITRGGFFYSIFDPVPPSSASVEACFSSVDTILAKIVHDRQDLLPGIGRRLKKFWTTPDSTYGRAVVSPGDLAEYHARKGIDDALVARTLEQHGFRVELKRYAVGRTAMMRWANHFLKVLLNFRIVAQRGE
jgi:SAM-dependent methyltransferase